MSPTLDASAPKPRRRTSPWVLFVFWWLVFGVTYVGLATACMFVADTLTPNAQGVLSVQVDATRPILHELLIRCCTTAMMGVVPFSLMSAASLFVVLRKRLVAPRVMIVCVGVLSLAGASLWVPNAMLLWPESILSGTGPSGLVSARAEVERLFPKHVVSPRWINPEDPDTLSIYWMIAEVNARAVVVSVVWAIGLVVVSFFGRRRSPHIVGPSSEQTPRE